MKRYMFLPTIVSVVCACALLLPGMAFAEQEPMRDAEPTPVETAAESSTALESASGNTIDSSQDGLGSGLLQANEGDSGSEGASNLPVGVMEEGPTEEGLQNAAIEDELPINDAAPSDIPQDDAGTPVAGEQETVSVKSEEQAGPSSFEGLSDSTSSNSGPDEEMLVLNKDAVTPLASTATRTKLAAPAALSAKATPAIVVPASVAVKEGWYHIQSFLSASYYLDVATRRSTNGTLIDLYRYSYGAAQAFRIFKDGDYYRIESAVAPGVYIGVRGGSSAKHGSIIELRNLANEATLFSILRNANGTYRFVNVASGLSIGAYTGKAENRAPIRGMADVNGSGSLSFKLLKHPGILTQNTYSAKVKLSGTRALSVKSASTAVGATLVTDSYTKSQSQKWYIAKVPNQANVYTLESLGSGLRLQSSASGSVLQARAASSKSQWWELFYENGYFTFRNLATGKVLDVSGASTKQGSPVIAYTALRRNNQCWKLTSVPVLDSGIYEIRNFANNGCVLDLSGSSLENGADILLYKRNGGINQAWIYDASNGTFTSFRSGRLLDITGAAVKSGTNVIQWQSTNGANQRWTVSYEPGGTYRIASRLGRNLVLGMTKAVSGNHAMSVTDKKTNAQRWAFKLVNPTRTYASSIKNGLKGISMSKVKGVGIDVSFWQGTINWKSVKAAGVDFAILRVGYGNKITDEQFASYVKGCKAYSIPFGVYYYSTAKNTTQAKAEANHALKIMKSAGVKASDLSFAMYYDLEEANMGKTANRKLLASITSTFLTQMKSNGFKTGVYANLTWWNSYLTDASFNNYDRWVAQWNTSCWYKGKYSLWQYTSYGKVPGISGNVDMNILY